MMKAARIFSPFLFVLTAILSNASSGGWTDLLDPQLSQWDTYLGYRHKVGYTGAEPVDMEGKKIAPIGYSKDPDHVFTVVEQNGEPVLRVSGEVYGCVFTRNEFENYRLRLKVKWGKAKWPPRTDKLNDSGILYHSNGPAGADFWRAWMLSQEFQIMEGHVGDFWCIGSSAIEIRAFLSEGSMNSVASETQPFRPFGGKGNPGFCLRAENHESKAGEWTDLELVCFQGKSLHIVNGHIVMVLKNSHYIKDGKELPLSKGKIQLQSEATEVFFKDIKIKPIDAMPSEYARLFQ